MKLWILSSEIANSSGADASVFTSEAEAMAAFREDVESVWGNFFPDEEMPEDTEEAWDRVRNDDDCADYIWFTETEISLPPVNDAGPDMLEALQLVVGSLLFDREDEVNKEVLRRINVAIAKAGGSKPVRSPLEAAAPEMLEIVRQYHKAILYYARADELKGDDEGFRLKTLNAALIEDAIARAEGRA